MAVLVSVLYWVRQRLAGLPIHSRGHRAPPLHRSVAALIGACIPICLAVVLLLPKSASDVEIASRALEFGLAPGPLSPWYGQPPRRQGLLLCVTNLNERRLPADCRRLWELAR